jgi:hypothetical protein
MNGVTSMRGLLKGGLAGLALLATPAFTASPVSSSMDLRRIDFFGDLQVEVASRDLSIRTMGLKRTDISLAVRPYFKTEGLDGAFVLTLAPSAVLDAADSRRTMGDIGDGKIEFQRGTWSLAIGLNLLAWDTADMGHPFGKVNHAAISQNLTLEDKLAQPMLQVAKTTRYGDFSIIWMPYLREPALQALSQPYRTDLPVRPENARYRVGNDAWYQSFALRWSHAVSEFEGASAYIDMQRDAQLEPISFDGGGEPTALRPLVGNAMHFGVTASHVAGPTLWKVEAAGRIDAFSRSYGSANYCTVSGGLEYTMLGARSSDAHLDLVLEGSLDSRGETAPVTYDDDAVYGVRLGIDKDSDSSLLLLGATDLESGGTSVRLEAEHQIAGQWSMRLEGRTVLNAQPSALEPGQGMASTIQMRLSYLW